MKKRMRTHNIILLIGITILVSCANTKSTDNSAYSKYSFTIHDSSYNHVFSKSDGVTLELFHRVCYCEKYNDTFRISQSIIDSLPYDFEDNLHFLGTPKISNDLGTKKIVDLHVLGFADNGYFKLVILE